MKCKQGIPCPFDGHDEYICGHYYFRRGIMSKPKSLSSDLLDAVRSKDFEAVKCVLAIGCKINVDALIAAAESGSSEVLQALLVRGQVLWQCTNPRAFKNT